MSHAALQASLATTHDRIIDVMVSAVKHRLNEIGVYLTDKE